MRILFLLLWGFFLLIPQLLFRVSVFGFPVGVELTTLLIVYTAFGYSFTSGMLGVVMLSCLAGVFSQTPPGYLMLAHLILFVLIQFFMSRIFTESYLTKSLWVVLFAFSAEVLRMLALSPTVHYFQTPFFWERGILQAVVDGLASFPLFILLDKTRARWDKWVSPRQAHLTGADFFHVRSRHRKYIS